MRIVTSSYAASLKKREPLWAAPKTVAVKVSRYNASRHCLLTVMIESSPEQHRLLGNLLPQAPLRNHARLQRFRVMGSPPLRLAPTRQLWLQWLLALKYLFPITP